MRKLFLAFAIVAMLFTACQKHDETPSLVPNSKFYVEYTINGTTVRYTNNTGALRQNYAGVTGYGYEHFGTNANGVELLFRMRNSSDITLGTFTDTAIASSNLYSLVVSLQKNGSVYHSLGPIVSTTPNHLPCTATMTSLTSDSLSGIFSGRVFFQTNPLGSTYLDITNGKFCFNF
jgi:hypothetical protein